MKTKKKRGRKEKEKHSPKLKPGGDGFLALLLFQYCSNERYARLLFLSCGRYGLWVLLKNDYLTYLDA